MKSITFTVPIYYKQFFKTKPYKIFLLGLNWYRNAHHHLSNKVKIAYHKLVAEAVGDIKFEKRVSVHYKIFMERKGVDGHNVRSVIEKFVLDGLVQCGAIEDDNTQIVIADTSEYFMNPGNPRAEITITEVE